MRYSILADIYEELEATTKKLKKTDIIAGLLKKTPAEELSRVVMLLSGNVYPPWEGEELGVAYQLMIKAISKATGISLENVNEKYKKSGDLGLTAEHFASKKTQKVLGEEPLTVKKVFQNLQATGRETGGGSQERKLALLAELFSQATSKEAKYIARTVLMELRVGVAEGLIRDAISKAFEIPVEIVENAWNVLPEYGEIAEIAKEKGVKGLEKVELKLGTPCIVLLAEKVPDLKTAFESFEHLMLQYKYDGMRSLIHKKDGKLWLFTRRLEDVSAAFPEVIEYARKAIKAKEIIVDGETLGLDNKTGKPIPFQKLSTRIKRKYEIEKAQKELPVQVNLFDILYLNGKTLFDKPLKERWKLLREHVKEIKGKFQFANTDYPKDLKEAAAYYKESLDAGNEGLIVKNMDALYVPGRSVAGGWLKVKPTLENLDVVIVGGTWGTGKRAGTIGSLILGIRDPDTGKFLEIGMLGTGIKEKKTAETEITLTEMTKMLRPLITFEKGNAIKVRPKIVIEVAYEEIQKSPTYDSGFALRFPRFIRLRLEKSIHEADDLARVKHIYEIQKGKKK